MGSMRSGMKNAMVRWFEDRYEEHHYERLMDILNGFISKYYTSHGPPNESVIHAVKFISMLSHANDHNIWAEPSVFYVTFISEQLNYKLEYKNWKKSLLETPVRSFSFFNYPFLFDPISKSRIMHIDSLVQMTSVYEAAHINQAFVMRANQLLEDSAVVKALEENMKKATNPFLILEIRREHFLADLLNQLELRSNDLKKPLKVRFVAGGEDGVDQGGVQKEFFQQAVEYLLDPAFGMFTIDPETRFAWFNPSSTEGEFELVGVVIGLALYNGVMLGVTFPPIMYNKLLGDPISFEDVEKSFPVLDPYVDCR
jgi:ubiquitin-protein ligase E3 A